MKSLAFTIALVLAAPVAAKPVATPDVGVAPQYDTTHVYVPEGDFDRFVASFSATLAAPPASRARFR
jgi:hypothetical protein